MVERFPRCFVPDGQAKRPLKIGIRDDLFAACPDLTKLQIHLFLRCYTRGDRYLFSVIDRQPRVDLNGNKIQEIDDNAIKFSLYVMSTKRRRQPSKSYVMA